jgi:hypothetical protein
MSTTTDTPTTTTTTGSSQTRSAPINGNIETYDGVSIPWTGGSRTNPRKEPASTKTYRPNDFKSKRKTEEDCEEGLGTENRLKTPEELTKDGDAILMTDWIGQIKLFMEKTGQDGVFHFVVKGVEVNLLKDYGSITPAQVLEGVCNQNSRLPIRSAELTNVSCCNSSFPYKLYAAAHQSQGFARSKWTGSVGSRNCSTPGVGFIRLSHSY